LTNYLNESFFGYIFAERASPKVNDFPDVKKRYRSRDTEAFFVRLRL